jgi:hypothetical protein
MCRLAAWLCLLCWATSSKSHQCQVSRSTYQIVFDRYAPTPADKPELKARRKNGGRADIKNADLFHLFEKYELTEQPRTLSTPTFSNACMRAAARQPFNDQDVIERLKSRTLTAEDVRADIDAWLEAIMVPVSLTFEDT